MVTAVRSGTVNRTSRGRRKPCNADISSIGARTPFPAIYPRFIAPLKRPFKFEWLDPPQQAGQRFSGKRRRHVDGSRARTGRGKKEKSEVADVSEITIGTPTPVATAMIELSFAARAVPGERKSRISFHALNTEGTRSANKILKNNNFWRRRRDSNPR